MASSMFDSSWTTRGHTTPFGEVIAHGENTSFFFTIPMFKGLLTNVETVCIVVISFRPFHLVYYIY